MNLGPSRKMVRLFLLLTLYHSSEQEAEVEIVYGIGIKLCNQKCIERGGCSGIAYNIDKLACHISHKTAMDWTEKEGYIPFPKQGNKLPGGVCTFMTCKLDTRCVERRRGGAVCVEEKTVTSALGSACVMDRDCPADMNSVCFTYTCKCEEGYTFDIINNRCVQDITEIGGLGEDCRLDSDCQTDKKFVCFKDTCKCEPGYHFNPSNESCLRRCNAYGYGFTSYGGIRISGYNNEQIERTTDEECSDLCIGRNEYTCITFERHFVSGWCLLSQYGYLDVPSSNRTTSDKGWFFEVRNCA